LAQIFVGKRPGIGGIRLGVGAIGLCERPTGGQYRNGQEEV
jgi:hypothetical protein